MAETLRQHAEHQFAEELNTLKQVDDRPRPHNWELSPQAVVTYLIGGKLKNGAQITPKYILENRILCTL